MLPPETLELVLSHVSRADLASLLRVGSFFHAVAARLLYRALGDVPTSRSIRLVRTLAQNDAYPALVRRFELDWSGSLLTLNFLRLLHRALQRLRNLTHLGLEFSPANSEGPLAWVLQDCPFALQVFVTSMHCEQLLARFFETQPTLTEVCLRGMRPVQTFSLPPSALPRLQRLRIVFVAPHIAADFVRGRPVESVSMSLYPAETPSLLDALLLSARPLKRLTVMSFAAVTPAGLVEEISARLPDLEALHVVARCSTHQLLVEMAPSLSRFRALEYLTFMAPPGRTVSAESESEIAALWHKACPTLKSIILPKGDMLGYVGGRWVSLQDPEHAVS